MPSKNYTVSFTSALGGTPTWTPLVTHFPGAAGLLIHLLQELPDSTGLALDMNAATCEEAERAARRADLQDRLTVVNRTVESLVDDPAPVRGAGVVHAGFVFHDVSANPELFDRVLRTCRESLADDGCVIATDAVAEKECTRSMC